MLAKNDKSIAANSVVEPSAHLCGMRAIARMFGVGRATVRAWKKAGAPILLVGKCYQASYEELWEWLKQNERVSFFDIP